MSVEWQGPAVLRRPAEALGVRIYHRATRLRLEGPKFGDATVEHLAALKSLQSLTLWQTSVSSAGLRKLRRALPDCQIEVQPKS